MTEDHILPDLLKTAGHPIAEITVRVSVDVLGLISQGLYSSPSKAIEELVANSYDADAGCVAVHVPEDLTASGSVIWVADDGNGMTQADLHDLWMIGESPKARMSAPTKKGRKIIGKFGIGKLAAYLLGSELTHITRAAGKILAVSTDFELFRAEVEPRPSADVGMRELAHQRLQLRELSESEAEGLLADLQQYLPFRLSGEGASPTWTVVGVAKLRPEARQLQQRPLRWVLRTMLPLNPQFQLFLGREQLQPVKPRSNLLRTWTLGADDKVAAAAKLATVLDPPAVVIPGIGRVTGTIELYEKSLAERQAKANEIARSYGFFVLVKKRVINLDHPLFGIPALSHQTFARFRAVVEADGLDPYLRSNRESVLEVPPVDDLRQYLHGKFNEVRGVYEQHLLDELARATPAGGLERAVSPLVKMSLTRAIRDAVTANEQLGFVRLPEIAAADDRKAWIHRFEAELSSHPLVEGMAVEATGVHRAFAEYDPLSRKVIINGAHPFYVRYAESPENQRLLHAIGLSEIVTATFLFDHGLSVADAREILKRRDGFMRSIVNASSASAVDVAAQLRDAVTTIAVSEAVAEMLSLLGFETSLSKTRVRGLEGTATATWQDSVDGERIVRVGIAAPAAVNEAVMEAARKAKASLGMDLVLVVGHETGGLAGTDGIGIHTPADLANILLTVCTSGATMSESVALLSHGGGRRHTKELVDMLVTRHKRYPKVTDILRSAWTVQQRTLKTPKLGSISRLVRGSEKQRITTSELYALFQGIQRLLGGGLSVEGDSVALDKEPESIIEDLRLLATRVPAQFSDTAVFRGITK